MKLVGSTFSAIAWINRVLGEFLRVRPWTTLSVLLSAALGRIFNLAAFFLPLKVILLVGSDGVPSYFRGFIQPEDRDAWILVIACGAVASYILFLLLERLSAMAAASASQDVLRGANVLTIFNMQDDIARDAYSRVCGVYSNALFVLFITAVGARFNPWFFLVIAVLLVVAYLFTAFLVRGAGPVIKGTMRGYIVLKPAGYLQILSSLTFLASFMYMLMAFLNQQMTNVLIAILSILIARQSLGAISGMINQLVALRRSEQRINAVVFRHATLTKKAPGELVSLAHYFVEQEPLEVLRRLALSQQSDLLFRSIEWGDPKVTGIYNFQVVLDSAGGAPSTISELQVFSPSRSQLRRNEELLFRYLSRELLFAPVVRLKGELPPFSVQVLGDNLGAWMPKREWASVFKHFLFRIKGLQPPRELVEAYTMSKPLLGDRINQELFSRLEVAVRNGDERRLLDEAYQRLDELRRRLSTLPLCIDNPDLTRGKVRADVTPENWRILNWGQWELVPLGAGSLDTANSVSAAELLAHMRQARNDVHESIGVADLEFAALCIDLEAHVTRKHLRKALKTLREILGVMPLLCHGTGEHDASQQGA